MLTNAYFPVGIFHNTGAWGFYFSIKDLWVLGGLRLKPEAVPDQAFLDGGDGGSGPILGRRETP